MSLESKALKDEELENVVGGGKGGKPTGGNGGRSTSTELYTATSSQVNQEMEVTSSGTSTTAGTSNFAEVRVDSCEEVNHVNH